jgi:hypothetical protein
MLMPYLAEGGLVAESVIRSLSSDIVNGALADATGHAKMSAALSLYAA